MTLRRFIIVFGSVLLAGCSVGPDYKAPEIKMPDAFSAALSVLNPGPTSGTTIPTRPRMRPPNTAPIDMARWWRALDDPELNALVERAVAGNLDLRIALARLQEARTAEQVAMGLALPAGTVAGAAGRGTGSDVTRGEVPSALTNASNTKGLTQINQIGGFEAGWEIDLFGKYRREIEAAGYDTEAAAAARNAVLITVIGDVVRAYVDLRGLQTRLAILQQNIAAESHEYDVVDTRFARGLTNELDVTLARRQLSSLKATVAPLAARIDAARNTIAVLLGRMPESLATELANPAMVPAMPVRVAAGLPLDLLRRRPDIREEERQLAAATARIGIATANLFPHLVISGAVGAQGQGLGVGPGAGSFLWSAGPGAYWNVLDFGTLDALVKVASFQAQAQLSVYKETILTAVSEVDNDIADYTAQQDRLNNLSAALTASRHAVQLAQQRYDRGLTDFLNLLDAERQEYGLEDEYARAQEAGADDFAALYKALGGGWESYQAIPPIRAPEPAIIAAFHALLEKN